MGNIVIFGGTFDPVHKGHLAMAEHVVSDMGAESCIWVPNKYPLLLKGNAQATTQQRLDMLSLAIKHSPYHHKFYLDLCEINRKGPSYSVDTLRHFRHQYGEQQSISLLMGEDAFVTINQWHEWESIIKLAHIIVVTRPKQSPIWPEEISAFFKRHCQKEAGSLCQKAAGFIYQPTLQLNISSTEIRHRLLQHTSLDRLCPKFVADYIQQHGLYS